MRKKIKYDAKALKEELKQAVLEQEDVIRKENKKCYDALRYVRPRTRLESLHADLCLTDKNFANILALGQIMVNHQELTDDDLREFIVRHKMLVFLNHLLKVVPDTIPTIRNYGEDEVVVKYVRVLEQKKKARKDFWRNL